MSDEIDLEKIYKHAYEERSKNNPSALTLDYWRDHFTTKVICESNEIKGKVLDLGCGSGEIDIWIARNISNVIISGIDICKEALDIANNHLLNELDDIKNRVSFTKSLIEKLPFEDNTFDVCFMSHTIEHINDNSKVFRELHRVLKRKSTVIIIVPFDRNYDDPTHVWYFKTEELKKYLEGFGTNIEVWLSPDKRQIAAKVTLFDKPKIIGMLRIKNEEKWIISTLEKASPMVSGFVILDDGSIDKTQELCKTFPKVLKYEYQNEPITDEVRDKNKLLKLTLEENPEWILALDGDEVFEDIAPEVIFNEISKCSPKITKISFSFLYMWDSHFKFRVDNKYQKQRHYRLFKVKDIGIDLKTLYFKSSKHGSNFHCGSIPFNLPGEKLIIDVRIKHYGYFEKSQRQRKFEFYKKLDPENAKNGFYNHLVDEKGMILLDLVERTFRDIIFSKK